MAFWMTNRKRGLMRSPKISAKLSLHAQNCAAAQPAAFQWPGSEIESHLHLNDT
jgi:hypothetical protein